MKRQDQFIIINMKAIEFDQQNTIMGKNQPEYFPLPAYKDDAGVVTSCFKFTFFEKLRVLFGNPVWISVATFNDPLQPIRLTITKPI